MSQYGYDIVQTLIVDIEPEESVKSSMNEINAGKTILLKFKHYPCFHLLWLIS